MSNDVWLWVATMFYAAHVMEEYFYDWRTWVRQTTRLDVEWAGFYLTNAAVIVFGICCAAIGWRLPEVSLMFPALMLINAVVFHILSTLRFRRFSPGLITAVLLFLPTGFLLYVGAAQDGVLTARSLLVSALGGAAVMAFPVLLILTRGKGIFKQD